MDVGYEKSSESALLISTVGRRRLCRRSREGYGGGGSFGGTFRVPSVTIATGGSGDMAFDWEFKGELAKQVGRDGEGGTVCLGKSSRSDCGVRETNGTKRGKRALWRGTEERRGRELERVWLRPIYGIVVRGSLRAPIQKGSGNCGPVPWPRLLQQLV